MKIQFLCGANRPQRIKTDEREVYEGSIHINIFYRLQINRRCSIIILNSYNMMTKEDGANPSQFLCYCKEQVCHGRHCATREGRSEKALHSQDTLPSCQVFKLQGKLGGFVFKRLSLREGCFLLRRLRYGQRIHARLLRIRKRQDDRGAGACAQGCRQRTPRRHRAVFEKTRRRASLRRSAFFPALRCCAARPAAGLRAR